MSVLYFKDKETGLFVAVKSIAGPKGDAGGYYIPEVDNNGGLKWIPSKEDMPVVDATHIVTAVLQALPTWEGGEF